LTFPGERKRVPRWAFEAVILLVIAIVVVLALRGDGEAGYWNDHPMLAELVSGLILLAIAGTVVERLFRAREERNWRGVARLACNTIGDEVARSISATLFALWRDAAYEPPPVDGPRGDRPTNRLLPEWEVRELPEGRDELAVLREGHELEAGPEGTLPDGRLEQLIKDEEWRTWACSHLRRLHTRARPALAQWAPVMLRAQGPRDLLDRAALVVDHLGYLRDDIKDGNHDGDVGELERRWVALDVQARLLSNALWEEAGEPDWCFALPDDPEDARYQLWGEPRRDWMSVT
jgi:hypothetical protein